MERAVDDSTKVRVEVELDRELVDLAANAGLDLNAVTDQAIQRALGPEQLKTVPRYAARLEEFRQKIQEEIAWYNAHIERDFSNADVIGREASDERARRWEDENAGAIRASNEELQRNGLWSDGYRLF